MYCVLFFLRIIAISLTCKKYSLIIKINIFLFIISKRDYTAGHRLFENWSTLENKNSSVRAILYVLYQKLIISS